MSTAELHAPEPDTPLVFVNDPTADPKPQSSPFRIFGAKERFEDPLHMFRGNAIPGVMYGDVHARAAVDCVASLEEMEAQAASAGHGLNRVSY